MMTHLRRLLFLVGCILVTQNASWAKSIDFYQKKLQSDGERSAVLNYMELGMLYMRNGEFENSAAAFENALVRIESVFSDNPQAEKARSLWYAEDEKAFKGEPYERVMAYYYRGLLALMAGDAEIARATFVSGLLQDAFAEEEQHRADFALLDYLTAWSAYKMDSAHLADVPLQRLEALRPTYPSPEASHNTLIIAEVGKGPRKLADGIGKYALVFRKGKKFKDMQASVGLASGRFPLLPLEDVYWQASTRGARNVDRIIKGKVEFDNSARTLGDSLGSTGSSLIEWSALDDTDALRDVGAAFAVIGLASKMLSMNVNTRADTRYWKSLPNIVNVTTAQLTDQQLNDIEVFPMDKFGNDINVNTQVTHVVRSNAGFNIVWSKSH
jgi:tetratricopeptide (TPR) repeat protein